MLQHKISTLLRVSVALILSIAVVSPLPAMDGDGRFAIEGMGQLNCGAFSQAAAERNERFYVFAGWLDGYLTAYNQHMQDTYDITPWQTVDWSVAVMTQFCQANPDTRFIYAVNHMIRALHGQRMQSESPLMALTSDGQGMYLYQDVLKKTQQSLAETGLYRGEADAEFDRDTRDAIRQFQKQHDLDPTGLPDQRTLTLLLGDTSNASSK